MSDIVLVQNNKTKYASLLQDWGGASVFFESWWLDAVYAGQQWDVLFSEDEDGTVLAMLPYCRYNTWRMQYSDMPLKTLEAGVVVRPDIVSQPQQLDRIATDLCGQLASLGLAYYRHQFPLRSFMPERFAKNGFKQTEVSRFVFEHLEDIDIVIKRFNKQRTSELARSVTLGSDNDMSAEEFYRFAQQCALEQHISLPYTREFFLVLYQKVVREHRGQLLRLTNMVGDTLAAAFLVWDSKTLYLLMAYSSRLHQDSGASARLLVEALKKAHTMQLRVDLCLPKKHQSASLLKQFGAEKQKAIVVSKVFNGWFRLPLLFRWFKRQPLDCQYL